MKTVDSSVTAEIQNNCRENSEMKRILFVAPSLTNGGMERVLVTIANCLAEAENDVTILLLDTADDLKSELDSSVRVIHKAYKPHFGKRLPYIRHKLYDDGMWETRANPSELYRYYIGSEKYDAEIAFFRGLAVKIISGSSNQDAVHLAWVHNDFRRARGYQNTFRGLNAVHEAYARMDAVVCVSKEARQGFTETIGDTGNVTVIYNMLPVGKIRALSQKAIGHNIEKAALHTVIVARLEDRAKGQLRLIDATARLRDEGRDISLTIVGGGNDEEAIRERVAERRAQSYIELVGNQMNPYPYIKDADLLVCASFYEGYNLTVAEALILSVPVLSTDCTGPREILDGGSYGMLVENSEQGIYEGLKQLADDPRLLSEYRQKTKQRQDFFDEDRILQQIVNLMKGER